ncbi:MAG: prepilin-type N-terminal cleavage/methylation protein [Betaproteobacteria bacterium]|nr:prepilin-type N-terminal cleavage/methylation protein [Betaproteobacteria bacterium]
MSKKADLRGFTLVELITTLIVIGILAAFAAPRFMDRTGFESRGFYDQAQNMVRYAQKIAIAQRRTLPSGQPIVVTITANSVSVCCKKPDGTGGAVIDPSTGSALSLGTPSGVAFAAATTFTFDGNGSPSAAQMITVNSTGVGDVSRTFYVDAVTGYVHCLAGAPGC